MPTPLNPTVSSVDFSTRTTTNTVTLLASNHARKKATIRNDADVELKVGEGFTPTSILYTDILPPGGRYLVGTVETVYAYFERVPQGRVLATEHI